MHLPVIDALNKGLILYIDKKRAYSDTKSPYIEELRINLPSVKENTIINKRFTKGNDKYKERSFDRSKVQMELICDGCKC